MGKEQGRIKHDKPQGDIMNDETMEKFTKKSKLRMIPIKDLIDLIFTALLIFGTLLYLSITGIINGN